MMGPLVDKHAPIPSRPTPLIKLGEIMVFLHRRLNIASDSLSVLAYNLIETTNGSISTV